MRALALDGAVLHADLYHVDRVPTCRGVIQASGPLRYAIVEGLEVRDSR